ncbi:MAG: LysR family transcriptional regulator [Rhodospirillum sp.]|nr:LysR family transcriptional regulator [Rhodospirillum sp.]MCF8489516.1 LysR family transcriptional regulator [Rhodospirillum sp.]MCF8500571.1 LysR family transcriptional regulator [Rhodospirillum sp.]
MGVEMIEGLGDRRVTLEQLRAFVLVNEDGGFMRASEELGRTQSAVSQSLQKLEDAVGCRLVDRRRGQVEGLTEEGRRFLPTAREVLSRLTDALGALKRPELFGRVRLGVPDDFPLAAIQGAISHCLALNPGLRVEVESTLSGRVASLLDKGQLDLGVHKRVTAPGEVGREEEGETWVLREEPLVWVARDRIRVGAGDALPLVLFPEGCSYRAVAVVALAAEGIAHYPAYVSSSYDTIHGAIDAGLGVGVFARGGVSPRQRILTEEEGFPPLPRVRLLLSLRGRSPAARGLAEMLRDSAGLIRLLDPAA